MLIQKYAWIGPDVSCASKICRELVWVFPASFWYIIKDIPGEGCFDKTNHYAPKELQEREDA